MSKNEEIIKSVYDFMIRHRSSGTSTLIKEISEKNDCYVIVGNESETKEFPNSINILNMVKYRGLANKPILIDNYALLKILDSAITRFYVLKEENEKLRKQIEEIEEKVFRSKK